MDYWQEAVDISLDEAGVNATEDQRAAVARDMEGSHECCDMAFYMPPPIRPHTMKKMAEEKRLMDLTVALEKRRDAIGTERDKLRELISEWEDLADSCDIAYDCVNRAIRALSEYV